MTTLQTVSTEYSTPSLPKAGKSSDQDSHRHHVAIRGFFTKELLIPGESKRQLARLRKNLMECYQPVGAAEVLLVEEIVAATWRLKRLLHAETHYIPTPRALPDRPTRIPKADYRFSSWLNHNRYEVSLNRQLYQAVHELERVQKARREEASARQDKSGG